MKILHISTNYKPVGTQIGHGGVERIIYWLCEEQKNRGHKISIATMEQADHPDAIKLFPRNILEVKATDEAAYARLMAAAFDGLVARLRQGEWDVVHDHMGAFALHLCRTCPGLETPVIVSCYAQPAHFAYTGLFRQLGQLRTALPNLKFSAGSLAHRTSLKGLLDADFVVYAGIPDAPLHDGARAFAYMTMAAVQPGKQQLELARLANKHSLPFIFAGPLTDALPEIREYSRLFAAEVRETLVAEEIPDGELFGVLQQAVARSGTVFVHEARRDSVRETLFSAASKTVLLNSTPEVFSQVLQESLARGIPAVAGPYPSAIETLMGFGDLVADLEEKSVLAALQAPAQSRTGIQAYCRARYAPKYWADIWDAIYRQTPGFA